MIPSQPDANPTAAPCVMVILGASGDLTKRISEAELDKRGRIAVTDSAGIIS